MALVDINEYRERQRSPYFDQFWSIYPRRIGKGAARRAWEKATQIEQPSIIIQAAMAHAVFWRKARTEMRYIPHPATWLNQERWDDDLEAEQDSAQSSGWDMDW
jgi:hypothetical protein